jgi:hypothetical protein
MAGLTVDQLSASFDARLDNNAQNLILFSGSFEQKLIPISSSNVNLIQDVSELTADLSNLSSSVRMQSASFNSRINVLKTNSGGLEAATFNAYTSSTNTKLSNLESYTSSYATTGSNTFSGAQTINSDLTVAGKITARLYHTELVSSSIVYESGSTKFGNTSDDVHAFTGSVSITGSLNTNHIHISSGSNTELLISNTGVGSQYRIQAGVSGHLAIRDINTNSTILRIGTGSVDFLDSIEVSHNITASFGKFIDVTLLGDLTASNFTGTAASIAVWGASNSLTSSNYINLTNGNQTLAVGTLGYTEGAPEALLITQIADSINIATFKGNVYDYAQLNVTNENSSTASSTDIVATADNGTETNMYVNLGINSSTYTKGEVGFENDGYLINAGEDLYIGSLSTGSHGHVHLFGGGHWQSSSISIYQDGKIGINTDKLNPLADTIPTAGYAVEISGSVKFNNSLNVTGSVYVSELVQATTIQGTGSMYLQPDVNDTRKIQIYNTGASDTHIKASGGLTFLGDDTNYVKIDDSLQTITIDSTNGVNIDTSVNITGSLIVSSSSDALFLSGGQIVRLGRASLYTGTGAYDGNVFLQGLQTKLYADKVVLEGTYGTEIIGDTTITGSLLVSSSNAVDVNVIGKMNVTGSLEVSSSNSLTFYTPSFNLYNPDPSGASSFQLNKYSTSLGGYYNFTIRNNGDSANGVWLSNGDQPLKIMTYDVITLGGPNGDNCNRIQLNGPLSVSGSTTLGNDVKVIGNTTISGSLIVSSSAAVDVNVIGAVNITGSLKVSDSILATGTDYPLSIWHGTGTTKEYNVAIGHSTLASNTTGNGNVALGWTALVRNTTGQGVTAMGSTAGYYNTTGDRATYIGNAAGFNNITGDDNTFLGYQAGYGISTGAYNTSVGLNSLFNNNGSNNAALGMNAGAYASGSSNSNVYIGNAAGPSVDTTESNKLYINNNNGSPLIGGDFAEKTVTISGSLTLVPQGAPSSPASGSLYFSSGDSHFYGWNGVQWKQLDN